MYVGPVLVRSAQASANSGRNDSRCFGRIDPSLSDGHPRQAPDSCSYRELHDVDLCHCKGEGYADFGLGPSVLLSRL